MKFLLLTFSFTLFIHEAFAQSTCPESVGTWAFATGPAFELKKEGTIFQDNVVKGTWTCDPETAVLRMTWKTGSVNQYVVAAGGNVLYTEVDGGYEVAAQMVNAPKKEGPANLMDKSDTGQSTDAMNLGKQASQQKGKTPPKKGTGGGVKGN